MQNPSKEKGAKANEMLQRKKEKTELRERERESYICVCFSMGLIIILRVSSLSFFYFTHISFISFFFPLKELITFVTLV